MVSSLGLSSITVTSPAPCLELRPRRVFTEDTEDSLDGGDWGQSGRRILRTVWTEETEGVWAGQMISSNSHRETWKLNFYWPAVTVSYHPVVECTEYSPAQKEEEMFAHVDQTVRDVVSDADDVETEHRLFLPILPSPSFSSVWVSLTIRIFIFSTVLTFCPMAKIEPQSSIISIGGENMEVDPGILIMLAPHLFVCSIILT